MDDITFTITEDQAESICKIFDKNRADCEDYEICEMLDKIIDTALVRKESENNGAL